MLSPGETRLWVYERNSTRVFRNIPANLASMRAYYTIIHQNGEEDDRFEKLPASDIEGPGVAVIRKLSEETNSLDWRRWSGWSVLSSAGTQVLNRRHQLLTMMKAVGDSFYRSMMSRPGVMEASLEMLQSIGRTSTSITAEVLSDSRLRARRHRSSSRQFCGPLR